MHPFELTKFLQDLGLSVLFCYQERDSTQLMPPYFVVVTPHPNHPDFNKVAAELEINMKTQNSLPHPAVAYTDSFGKPNITQQIIKLAEQTATKRDEEITKPTPVIEDDTVSKVETILRVTFHNGEKAIFDNITDLKDFLADVHKG